MPSSGLLNVPRTQAEWDGWSFNHALEHQKIIQAIQAQTNVNLIQYQLDPINFNSITEWLEWHQQTHLDMDGVLGLQSNDLQDVKLDDEKNRESFIYLNWTEHFAANQVLGV